MENRKLPKLDLNITNRCNFRCSHCAFDSGIIEMPEFTLNELERILVDTQELGGERFDITGGEPLVRNDVEEIISIGKNLGYKIELVTNGSLLTGERLRKFKEVGLDGIAISLDGSNPEVYNRIRKKEGGTFYRVLENIKEAKKFGFYTKVNTVVFDCNLEDIPKITDLALKLGVDEHGIYYFTPVGRGERSREISVEPVKWLDFIRKKIMPYSSEKMKISIESPIIEKEYWNRDMGCIADVEKSHLQILPNGDVYPCAILASYNKPIANLRQTSVKDIWNNKKLWKDYWENLSGIFGEFGGCVDFNTAFNIDNYSEKYRFVCPIRKFKI